MKILALESSCDETACAILQKEGDRITILSKVIASSASLQAKYGGVIPEQAAREQLKSIIPVIEETIDQSPVTSNQIDAIAVTEGPGLIGSLLIGVETAKTLSLLWNKPLIPVNHLTAHFYANWVTESLVRSHESSAGQEDIANSSRLTAHDNLPSFPTIGLLISGGHTDLILMKAHGEYLHLGGTRDDAAGECFDKCARLLELPYPGGPNLSKLAESGDPYKYNLPKPMWDSKDLDFSFSGLKTAVANILNTDPLTHRPTDKADLAAGIEQAIIDILIKKAFEAVQRYNVEQLIIAGGVASNSKLKARFQEMANEKKIKLFIPKPELCTDNAVMVGASAFFLNPINNPLELQANPNLSLRP